MANVLRSLVSYVLSSFSVVSAWRIDLVAETPSWLDAGFLTPALTCVSSCFSTETKPPLASFSLFLQFQIFRPLILLLLTLKVSLLKEELMLCVSFSHPSVVPFATASLHISMVPK